MLKVDTNLLISCNFGSQKCLNFMNLFKSFAIVIIGFVLQFFYTDEIDIIFQSDKVVKEEIANAVFDDPGLDTPLINTSPLPKYDYDKINYGMNIGIERTPKGKIWACWVGGGDNDKAFFILARSDDEGISWSKPRLVIDPHEETLLENRRTIVGNLWLDPLGRLWIFF
jgi:hypothetical protein